MKVFYYRPKKMVVLIPEHFSYANSLRKKKNKVIEEEPSKNKHFFPKFSQKLNGFCACRFPWSSLQELYICGLTFPTWSCSGQGERKDLAYAHPRNCMRERPQTQLICAQHMKSRAWPYPTIHPVQSKGAMLTTNSSVFPHKEHAFHCLSDFIFP